MSITSSPASRAVETLGPIINCFMHRLDARLVALDRDDTRVLMALRAGLRIEDLYRVWREARGQSLDANRFLMPASRMISIKACYKNQTSLALATLWNETQNATTVTLVHALLNSEFQSDRLNPDELGEIPLIPLHEFLALNTQGARVLRDHLVHQSETYAKALAAIANGADRMVLVDSGWKGTSQMLLESSNPQYQWEGLYFGAIGRSNVMGIQPSKMTGIMFDSHVLRKSDPASAILVHRHLIESLFEPGVASTEAILDTDVGARLSHTDLLKTETPDPWDDAYKAVREYLKQYATAPYKQVLAEYESAMDKLSRILRHPTQEEVLIYCGKSRSFDLGRVGSITSVYPTENRWPWDNPDLRVKQSIWKTGQVALEFQGKIAKRKQDALLTALEAKETKSYFSTKISTVDKPAGSHVAIITRTKDRPVLLRRAAESVANSTHTDYTWVIINDGGDLEPVEDVVANCLVDPSKIIICHNPESLGMEAASNVGINASKSDFIVIHDDDDSWEPEFLEKTVSFLHENSAVYKGVITGTTYVSEEINNDAVIEHGRSPYQSWVRNVQLAEMAAGNYFAPIAFLFRRDIYEKIGGFDENLPVLGDWDFNLRFLLHADIGVIPDALANYHHRDRSSAGGSYSNSVIGGIDKHAAYASIMRNKYYRLMGINPAYGVLASLVGAGYFQDDVRNRISSAREQIVSAITSKNADRQLQTNLSNALRESAMLLEELSARRESLGKEQCAIIENLKTFASFDNVAAVEKYRKEISALSNSLKTQVAPRLAVAEVATEPVQPAAQSYQVAMNGQASASWMKGQFADGWIGVEAMLSTIGAKAVRIGAWLPLSSQHREKTIKINDGETVLSTITIERGISTSITVELDPARQSHLLYLSCEYPEMVANDDMRLLGFIGLDLAPLV